jgi:O-antigen/teichoic acid export membrane protein
MGLLAAGFGLVATSSAGVLAVGPRVMSHGSFSGISVGVLISVVFGFGVATPTEQLMSRRQNAGDFAQGKSPAYWLGICASLTVLAILVMVVATDAGHRYAPMTWSVLAVLGWYLVSPRRGDLLGRQRVPAYALTMIIEGAVRLLLVLSAAIWRDVSVVLLGLSIGLPIVVSAGSAQLLRDRGQSSAMRALAPGFEHVSFVAIALGYQVALNLPPVALSWKVSESDRDFVGAFVVANSWMRLPTILVGSITVSALVELSRAAGRGSVADFRRTLVRSGVACLALGLGGAVVCGLTAGPATTLLYGSHVTLPSHGTTYLAVSTVMAIACSWLSVPLMALRRPHLAAWIWSVGSTLVFLTLILVPAKQLITVGLIGPLLVTTILLAAASRHRFRQWGSDPSVA